MTWIENAPVVVLLARQFNPSIMTQMWLVRHGVLDQDGRYNAESIFTQNLVQVVTNDFVLVVTPDQLQFLVNVEPGAQPELIQNRVGAIVHHLPHVPFRAVGLNFHWHIVPDEGEGIPLISRALFAGRGDGVFGRFNQPDARFGAYLSRDFGQFRMKVDIKPIKVDLPDGVEQDRIQFGFNFHSDVPRADGTAEAVLERFTHWNAVRNEAVETIRAAGYGE